MPDSLYVKIINIQYIEFYVTIDKTCILHGDLIRIPVNFILHL
jgi:hypothetical protein